MAKYKVQGIGKFVKNLITTTKLSNKEILEKVKVAFPEAQTSMACIAWYQTDLRKKAPKAPIQEQSPPFGWFKGLETEEVAAAE